MMPNGVDFFFLLLSFVLEQLLVLVETCAILEAAPSAPHMTQSSAYFD